MTATTSVAYHAEEVRSADAQIRDGMPHTLLMTFLTGIPYTGQRRLRLTPGIHLVLLQYSTQGP